MLRTVEGVFREGKVELQEVPAELEGARVLVTFLPGPGPVDLRAQEIDEGEAADARWRLASITDDWNRPEMDVYDEP